MWFKQVQLFQIQDTLAYSPEAFCEKLEPLLFVPCLPSMPSSIGWVPPIEEEGAPLVHALNGKIMLCMQLEEKVLPGVVIRQALDEKVKKIQARDDRRVRAKEKMSLKDEVVMTLLPRAFTKLTRVYGYVDTKNNWLVIGNTNASKIEQFLLLFKKTVTENVRLFDYAKPAPIMTHWLKNQSNPTVLSIEKACMLQDPQKQNRVIRCQQQDLFAPSIQGLIKDGCEVKQLALCWQDRINFVLADDFSLRGLQYQEEVLEEANGIESETKQQQFDADFFIMTETLTAMLHDLISVFCKEAKEVEVEAA